MASFSGSQDSLRRRREMRPGRIAKPVRTAIVAHKTLWAASEKSRKISALAVDLSQFRKFSDRQHDAVI